MVKSLNSEAFHLFSLQSNNLSFFFSFKAFFFQCLNDDFITQMSNILEAFNNTAGRI